MSQPKPHIKLEELTPGPVVSIESENCWAAVFLSSSKTKKTAYKRAAANLRKLADEAERLAEES